MSGTKCKSDRSTKMKIVYVSLYTYKSFPVRIFHALSRRVDIDSYAIFFKDSSANKHKLATETENRIFVDLIRKINPDFVAISILSPYVVVAKKLIQCIRNILQVPIIVGGKYPTVFPLEALEFADFVCKGEGEQVLTELFERFRKGLDFRNIQGLWYKDESGQIIKQGLGMLLQNLDEIPFPALGEPQMYFIENNRLIENDPELKDPDIWVMASRGCAYQCSYCINSLLLPMYKGEGKFLRLRTPDNVIQEIEMHLRKRKYASKVRFVDELFGTSNEWNISFCEKYKKIGLPFACELNPNLIRENNIEILADAGLYELDFGIQSGSDEVRNWVMNRPGTNKEILEKVNILKKYNVNPRYDLILDNPFDNTKTLEETIDLLFMLPEPRYFNIYKMQFFRSYPFTMRALQEGFITENDLTDENIAESVFKNWAFIPKVFPVKRRNYLQSCIYLLAWNSVVGKKLSTYLRKKGNSFFLGFLANILARNRHYYVFAPRWLRRLFSVICLISSGNLKLLVDKIYYAIKIR